MRRVSVRAPGYKESELISSATLRTLLKYDAAAPAFGVLLLLQVALTLLFWGVPKDGSYMMILAAVMVAALIEAVKEVGVCRARIARSSVSTERKR